MLLKPSRILDTPIAKVPQRRVLEVGPQDDVGVRAKLEFFSMVVQIARK